MMKLEGMNQMSLNNNEIIELRKRIIENEFNRMNDMQKKAVLSVNGQLLILAGAGSGKTTVIVNRIANILRFGEAYESDKLYGNYSDEECSEIISAARGETSLSDELAEKLSVGKVNPWRILAITFTNKAANELKERICNKVGEDGSKIWASTFHSCCSRILRSNGELLGYTSHFTVYDTEDTKKLIKDCMKALQIDDKTLPVRSVQFYISRAKDSIEAPADFKNKAGEDSKLVSVAAIYEMYQKRLKAANAMDFDDIILNTVQLFKQYPEVLEKYQEQFRYIMVDEYQDTNQLQYELIRLLTGENGNLCVVGDDDQSIYKFRGATIENILNFEDNYPNAKVIRLEQNYRSTKMILSAANGVIENNEQRKGKTLWTENDHGEPIHIFTAFDEQGEASYIARTITDKVSKGAKFSDFAILYRMNSQSQNIERAFTRMAVPYRVIGGHRFFDRMEIRDMIAYLAVICNHDDNVRLKRIVNVPKRAIGEGSIARVENIAGTLGKSIFQIMNTSDEFSILSRVSTSLLEFCKLINDLTRMLDEGKAIADVYDCLLNSIGYRRYLLKTSDHAESAIENIEELKSSIMQYEEENGEDASLEGFLEEVALLTDIDNYNSESDSVVMMTLHSAKGLEFPYVFIPGMEDGIFPGYHATLSEEDLQEERRLAYVGITRAKKEIYLVNAESRTVFGKTSRNRPSRFISEIPTEFVKSERVEHTRTSISAAKKNRPKPTYDVERTITPTTAKSSSATFRVGDKINHKIFGPGLIVSATKTASDMLLEVSFEKVGTKKLMANFLSNSLKK